MDMIKSADWEFLRKERSKIFGYWGVRDGWVDEEEGRIGREILGGEQEAVTKEDREQEEESGVQRVSSSSRSVLHLSRWSHDLICFIGQIWHCVESIPHAFCLGTLSLRLLPSTSLFRRLIAFSFSLFTEHGEIMAHKIAPWTAQTLG